ncbi:MAG TPA: hypothetical protein VFR23_04220 [Jiangellaceae bacterium]|nr:hypothetical protein [Jiangellaceae bacterium]
MTDSYTCWKCSGHVDRPADGGGFTCGCGATFHNPAVRSQSAREFLAAVAENNRRLMDAESYDDIVRWLMNNNRFEAGGNPGNESGWWIRITSYTHPDGSVLAREGDWIVRDGTEFRVEAA